MTDDDIDLPNPRRPAADLLLGGQPSRAALAKAHALGFHTVVNLRCPEEHPDFDEGAAVRALGMRYVCIPVAGPGDLDDAAAHALDGVLADPAARPALIHCASGNRVGGLFAVHACCRRGATPEEALALGRAAGLSSPQLHEALRRRLETRAHAAEESLPRKDRR